MSAVGNGHTEATSSVRPLTSTERSRRSREKAAAASAAMAAASAASAAPPLHRHDSNVVLGGVLGLVGITVAALGLGMTVRYLTIGTAGVDRVLFAGLAGSADMLALLTPSAAVVLWRGRRWLLAVACWTLWIAASAVTLANLGGFVGTHADMLLAGRENASTERQLILDRIARLRADRHGINEHRSAAEIVVAILNAGRRTIYDERTALAIAKRRDQLDSDLAEIERSIATLPAVVTADPASSGLAGILALGRVGVSPETLARLRSALLLVLPLTGGLVLAVGISVAQRRKGTAG